MTGQSTLLYTQFYPDIVDERLGFIRVRLNNDNITRF